MLTATTTQTFAEQSLQRTTRSHSASHEKWVGPYTIKSIAVYEDGDSDDIHVEIQVNENVTNKTTSCSLSQKENSFTDHHYDSAAYSNLFLNAAMSAQAQGKRSNFSFNQTDALDNSGHN